MIFRVFGCDHILSFVRETEIQQQLVDVFYTKDDTPQSSYYNTYIFSPGNSKAKSVKITAR